MIGYARDLRLSDAIDETDAVVVLVKSDRCCIEEMQISDPKKIQNRSLYSKPFVSPMYII